MKLDLNFDLKTIEERNDFAQHYISENPRLSKAEAEKVADYILWGNTTSGKNLRQTGEIELTTRAKTWDKRQLESLDALRETPGFREISVQTLGAPIFKTQNTKLSRDEVAKTAPSDLLRNFQILWNEIDRLELKINFFDILQGKRKDWPRAKLLSQFAPSEVDSLFLKASTLTSYQYLKLRHLIVELRRQQFAMRDLYLSPILPIQPIFFHNENEPLFSTLPFQISDSSLMEKVFPSTGFPDPAQFSQGDLQELYNLLWTKPLKDAFNFQNLEHLLSLIENYENLLLNAKTDPQIKFVLRALAFYIENSDLGDANRAILSLKAKQQTNETIKQFVNKKYHKSYNNNYISTIYRQKIIPQLAETARYHREVLENLFYPENFKTCRVCGKTLLVNAHNFVRKATSRDGFSHRCKKCDKNDRARRK